MHKGIKSSLDSVYDSFKQHTLKNCKSIGCFDFGPTDAELEDISKNLKDIPDEIVGRMEFFDKSWNSWGSKEEIKYFLPRVFEYIANDIHRLADPGTFSFFKYKLAKCLLPDNQDWNEGEKQAIRNFFSSLLAFYFSSPEDIADLIEAALAIGISPESLLVFWEQNATDKVKKIKYLEDEYKTSIKGDNSVIAKQRLYYENTDELSRFLSLIQCSSTNRQFKE